MRRLSLNTKMAFAFVIFTIAAARVSYMGIAGMSDIYRSVEKFQNVFFKRGVYATSMRDDQRQIVIAEKNMVLSEAPEYLAESSKKIAEARAKFDEEYTKAYEIATDDGKAVLRRVRASFDEFMASDAEVQNAMHEGKPDEAVSVSHNRGRAAATKLYEEMDAYLKLLDADVVEEAARSAADYAWARNVMVGWVVTALLSGILSAVLVLRVVSRSIDRVITDLGDSSTQVTAAAQQIASSSQELSQAAGEQASSLQETSSAIEEMSSMIKRNAESARQSTDFAQTCASSARKGKEVMTEMSRAMAAIDASGVDIIGKTKESNARIGEIVKVIAEIGNKTKVIDEIVFQTKLLSFNASVEAARAGQHGKGFAVVAEEVGNLAQMSGNAAKEITTMLDSSIQKVEAIVRESNVTVEDMVMRGRSKIEAGVQVSKDCAQALDEIVVNVGRVTEMAHSIAAASEEQAKGITEITRAVAQLDQVTQRNAATSEETASAAAELSAQADSLRGVVGTLVLTIKGGNGSAGVSPVATAAAVTQPQAGRVLAFAPQSKARSVTATVSPAASRPETLRLAVGSDAVPSEDDPRFKSV